MGMISNDDVNRVRDATDLVAIVSERVTLKQRGREFWGCCPFHNEKTPSFKVDSASQFWHCFGCGEGGDVFKYLMKLENMEFPDAVRYLASRSNIEITEDERGGLPSGARARLIAACAEAADFYHLQLMRSKSPEAAAARSYLSERGLGGSIPKDWMLGYAPGRGALVKHLKDKGYSESEMIQANLALPSRNGKGANDRFFDRVMFPICDVSGRNIGFGGRIIKAGSAPQKYLNTSDTPLFHKTDNLFAIDKAKASITTTGMAIVVEGYTDVIAMHSCGFTNTVATLGTSLTKQHVKLLTRFAKKVVYLFDGDEAGLRAADRASTLIEDVFASSSGMSNRAELYMVAIPDKMDPADYCSAHGREGMQSLLDSAVPLLRFSIDRRLAKWNLDVPEQRQRALASALDLLVPLNGTLLVSDYLGELADRLNTSDVTVRSLYDRTCAAARKRRRPAESSNTAAGAAPTVDAAPIDAYEDAWDESSPEPRYDFGDMDNSTRTELDLLALYAHFVSIRPSIVEELGAYEWSSPSSKLLSSKVFAVDAALPSAEFFSCLSSSDPEAFHLLASRTVACEEERVESMAARLIRTMHELNLEHRIRMGNARLRHPEQMSAADYDELFVEVARLQKELSALRKSSIS